MSSKIAIEKNLNNLVEGLKDLGYDVETFDREYNGYAQAIIYSGNDRVSQNTLGNFGLQSITSHFYTPQSTGALIINGDNKTVEEINYCIKNRVYSPLF